MSGWRRLAERAGLAVLCCATARGQTVEEWFAQGRYDQAFVALEALPDPALRAEWRYHLLHAGGDLTGAFRAALEGLLVVPDSLRLLEGATDCAVTLGLGERALDLCERWRAAAQRIPDEADRSSALEAVERYVASARALMATSASADAARRRAQWVAVGGLGAVCALLVLVARRSSSTAAR